MLSHLHIRDFAIVDELDLEGSTGMTVLTGETGAGKSILLDALGLTLGDRADTSVVRHGAERAEIVASFAIDRLPEVTKWLREHELDGEGECLLRRTVNADGGSRGYINGRPVAVQLLRELGEQLVDIHGQHAHQYLLRADAQRQTIDGFGGLTAAAEAVAAAFRAWRELQREFEALSAARRDREARLDLLRYQVEELAALELRGDELAALEEEHQRLANVTRLQEGAHRAAATLNDEDGEGAATLLERAAAELRELSDYDSALAPLAELVESAAIQAKEAGNEVRHYLSALDLDPERLEAVEQRLDAVQGLARKHRCREDELPELLAKLQEELEQLDSAETRFGDLEARIGEARAAWQEAADRLGQGRREAADRLSAAVTDNMAELGMGGGRFVIEWEPTGDEPSAHGRERALFLVTTNAGQPPRPLQKVASGGELSRISLAIQVITAGTTGIPTLIFDEVDVGVGGGVAEIVGRKLRQLADSRQVLCVTHQPQVAAQGHHHHRIRKASAGGHTRTRVDPLDPAERVDEIARMLGGLEITDQTRSHAREMIELAQAAKSRKRSRKVQA